MIATLRTISYRTLDREHDSFDKGNLQTRPLRFNCVKIFLDVSSVQCQRFGIVTKKQGFPKQCTTLANSRDHAIFCTNTEYKSLLTCGHIYARCRDILSHVTESETSDMSWQQTGDIWRHVPAKAIGSACRRQTGRGCCCYDISRCCRSLLFVVKKLHFAFSRDAILAGTPSVQLVTIFPRILDTCSLVNQS